VFEFYNAWWVFGEVAQQIDYDIFMAEAENVGYKRTKRGANPMPNDLYNIEYAPNKLNTQSILDSYDAQITILQENILELQTELDEVNNQIAVKETPTLKKKAEGLEIEIGNFSAKAEGLQGEKAEVESIFATYYDEGILKPEFAERTDATLIGHFKNGVLARYRSDDIVLRTTEMRTILDMIRKEVIWA